MATDFIAAVTGSATAGTPPTDFIAEVAGSATSAPPFTVTVGADVEGIEPFTTVAITPVVLNGTAASLVIDQIQGPEVLLFGTGPWTYKAPGDDTALQLRFQITATDTGGTTAVDEVSHFVYPNTWFSYNGLGQYKAAETVT